MLTDLDSRTNDDTLSQKIYNFNVKRQVSLPLLQPPSKRLRGRHSLPLTFQTSQ